MSVWEKITKFPHEVLMREVIPLYGDHFPFEVRHYLADLVESLPWEDIHEHDVQHEDYAKQAYISIVHGLQTAAEKAEDFVMKTKMTDFASKFKALYAGSPMDLVSVMKKCLKKEKSLLQSMLTPQNELGSSSEQQQDITASLEQLQQMIKSSKDLLHQLQNRQLLDDFCIRCQKWQSISDSIKISVPDENTSQLKQDEEQLALTGSDEIQARELIQKRLKACDLQNSGQILNNSGTMEYQRALGHFSISFTKMKLTKISRKRESSEKAPEEKFCILYQARFSIGQDLDFPVHTMSLPVVVTSHTNQESDAMATILWDNQFSQVDRLPFIVPDVARWSEVAAMLSAKFASETGRPLTDDDLQHLASKILGGDSRTDYSEAVVTWAQFNKNLLNPGVKWTFWMWLYSIIKLVRDKAVERIWAEGLIMGFVSKEKARDLLMTKPSGTFLLRFSDSTLGGISLAWIEDDVQTGGREVKSLEPFTKTDFTTVGLAEMIMGHSSFLLVNLFPDIPKGSVFTKHLKEGKTGQDGYIQLKLILDITGSGTGPKPLQNQVAPVQELLPQEDDQLMKLIDTEDLVSWFNGPDNCFGETDY